MNCKTTPMLLGFAFSICLAQVARAAEPAWSLNFLIVDESGEPLPQAKVSVAYLKNDDPNIQVTPTNSFKFMVYTNLVTDSNGLCRMSERGSPDAWQCNFNKTGFRKKYRIYSGPSNFTGMSGPGAPQQRHTEMLVRTNADPLTWPKLKVTFKVFDEAGIPMQGASAAVYYYTESDFGNSVETNVTGLTDADGVFVVSGRPSSSGVAIVVNRAGYYESRKGMELYDRENYDPVVWSPNFTTVLKKLGQAIPMYAKRIRQGPPVAEKPIGYDLEVGDWVPPYGKGNSADIFFTAHFEKRAENDWDYKLVVSFPKPGDGIQPFSLSDLEKASALRSPHEAPEGGYKPEWIKTRSRRPGEPSTYGSDANLSFFFRVRIVLDDKGNVKTANYGKIYGDFMDFQYFLNPEPNSRGIEFDPAKNLLKQLGPDEHVNVP